MSKILRNKLNLAIIFFVAAIIPLVVKLNLVNVNSEEFHFIRNNRQIADVFSYSKSHLIILSCALICIVYLIYFLTTSEKINFACVKRPIYFLPAAFVFFIIISTLFSKYPLSALYGISERYEGAIVLIAYVIFFATVINSVKSVRDINFVFYSILFSALFILLIGLSQFLGHDFLISSLGKKILLAGFKNKSVNIKPIFDTAYSTLYNPNCLGLYCSMIFPIMFCALFFFKKNLFAKYFSLLIAVLAIINLFASNSTGALTGIIVSMIFMVNVICFIVIKNKLLTKRNLMILFGTIVLSLLIIFLTPIKNNLSNMLFKFTSSSNENFFTDLKVNDNSIEIFYHNGKIKLEYSNSKLQLYENNEKLEIKNIQKEHENDGSTKTIYNYNSKTLSDIQIIFETEKIILLKLKNINFVLGLDNDKLVLLSNKGQIIDTKKNIEHFGFKNHELFASSRGYIWSRSIPLIKNNILIGSGPDTFVFNFPQNDIIGKLKFHDSPYIIVDKPHNFYLQTIINTGLVSLIILLTLFGYYFIKTIKFLINKNKFFPLQLGLSSGIVGYLISILATDSVVSVAPIFWIIFGLSFAINFFEESV